MWSHLWVQSQIWRLTLWLLCCMQHCVIPEFMTGGFYDDVIKWKYFPRFCPFVRGIPRSPENSPHKGQWNGALMFSLFCAWIDTWINNGEAGDSRRHWYVIVMPPVDFIHGNAFCTALLALCEGNPMVNNWFTKNPAMRNVWASIRFWANIWVTGNSRRHGADATPLQLHKMK